MRKLILLLLFIGAAMTSVAGIIRGKVLTSDGKPAAGVTVILKDTKKMVISDDNGAFVIKNVSNGNYELIVMLMGQAPVHQPVTVGEQPVDVSIQLNVSDQQLEEVVVTSGTNKFAKKESDFVARMPLANIENPQVYSVVNKDLITEQVAIEFKDALKNTPGLMPTVSPAGTVSGAIRGFTIGNFARNGMATQAWTLADPVNIENIEVIKGPSATLFGTSVGYFGGLINQVTKKPFNSFKGEVAAYTGSWGLGRLTADINAPVNDDKTALLRVNAAVHSENSFMNMGHQRSVTFAPSFLYKVSDKLTLYVDAEIYKGNRTQQPYYTFAGNTFRNFKDMPIDYYKSLGGEDVEGTQAANNYYAKAEYKISEQWTSVTNVAYSQNRVDKSNQIYPRWVNDSIIARSVTSFGPRAFTSIQAQQNFVGDFMIGNMRNRLLAGIDVFTYDGRQRYTSIPYDTINVRHPFKAMSLQKIEAILAGTTPLYVQASQNTFAAYASDVLNLTTRLNLMLSLRVDRFENKTDGAQYGQTALSPKLGIVYQVLKDQLSVFANYMNSFSNVAPVVQPDGSNYTLKPQEANQWEAGLKLDVLNHKLNATLSYYNIDVKNGTRKDDNLYTIQDVTQASKGVDLEVAASPVPGLNIVAGYSYNENRLKKAAVKTLEGKLATNTPRSLANCWISYKIRHIGVGVGGNYVSDAYWDAANTFIIPAYVVANATLFYDQPKWRVGLKLNNITSEKYWNASGYAQAPRQFIGTVALKF